MSTIVYQRATRIRFILKNALATTSLILGVATASPAAAVQCGDTIGPNQTVTLQADLVCDYSAAHPWALTVIGPAKVYLNGHALKCEDLNKDGSRPYGLYIEGQGAKVDGNEGHVSDCVSGVYVGGQGRHTVENVIVTRNRTIGFDVQSDKNTLRQNLTAYGPRGFFVFGGSTGNKLLDNGAILHTQAGFRIDGTKHQLQRNYAYNNGSEGFGIYGVGHKLRQNEAFDNWHDGIAVHGDSIVPMQNTARTNNRGNIGSYDLRDGDADCGTNTWKKNTFGTASQACIQ